jgi:hypothetical protein
MLHFDLFLRGALFFDNYLLLEQDEVICFSSIESSFLSVKRAGGYET